MTMEVIKKSLRLLDGKELEIDLEALIDAYPQLENLSEIRTLGEGHINQTYLIALDSSNKYTLTEPKETSKFVLQKINTTVFKNPLALMDNIMKITSHMANSKDAHGQRTLQILTAKTGMPFHMTSSDECWRVYAFIAEGETPGQHCDLTTLRAAGQAFGGFLNALDDFDPNLLHEVIPDFHHTKKRFDDFNATVKGDPWFRASIAKQEIEFVQSLESEVAIIVDGLKDGTIPLRVTHNDTKVSNVLVHSETFTGICVIDLDTVMPGSALYDYGDGIRSTISLAAEDEKDLTRVTLDFDRFRAFTGGFLDGTKGVLTRNEIDLMPLGAILMTFECGMRFLADYLNGDLYFRIYRSQHNLDRARTQFKLVQDMMMNIETLKAIVKEEAMHVY